MDRKKGLASLAKKLGSGMYALSDQTDKEVVSTGIATLDAALGVGGFVRGSQNILYGAPSAGKALENSEPVLTSDGWMPICDVKVGDMVMGASGKWSKVLGVFPQGTMHLNRVSFSNGVEVVCSDDHIWSVRRKESARVVGNTEKRETVFLRRDMTVSEMLECGVVNSKGSSKFYVAPSMPFEEEESSLPVDPYLLGVLIGDGTMPKGKGSSTIRLTNCERDVTDKAFAAIPEGIRVVRHESPVGDTRSFYSFVKKEKKVRNALTEAMKRLGLMVGSKDKFIPDVYKTASIKQRAELLRGLCDSDGHVEDGRAVSFSSTSKRLSEDVEELVISLGGIIMRKRVKASPGYTDGEGHLVGIGSDCYVVTFRMPLSGVCPVSSRKHLKKMFRGAGVNEVLDYNEIVGIEDAGFGECTCIAIDDPTHCYLTRGGIPTHNTAMSNTFIAELQKNDPEAMACIIDIERSASREWLEKFGVDVDRVHIIQEPTIEEAVNAFQEAVRTGVFDVILIDSLGAVVRSVDFDGKDGKGGDANVAQVGGSSGVITRWVNKANSELIRLDKMERAGEEVIKPVIIYINQVRDNLKSMYGGYTMPGGNALRHMAGVIIRVTASGASQDKVMGTPGGVSRQVGNRVNCVIEKNKYAPPKRMAGYNFVYEECPEHEFGIDNFDALVSLGSETGVLQARGAWMYYKNEGEDGFVKANGRKAMVELMRDNPEFYEAVRKDVMSVFEKEAEQDGQQA